MLIERIKRDVVNLQRQEQRFAFLGLTNLLSPDECRRTILSTRLPRKLWLSSAGIRMVLPHQGSSIPDIDLSGDESLNGDVSLSKTPVVESSRLKRIRSFLTNLPWIHAAAFIAVLVVGSIADRLVTGGSSWTSASMGRSSPFMIVVCLGMAVYGCVVNRRLQSKLDQQRLLGPYKLHELIGSGGMGDVYLAEHQLLKRKCAVKLIRRDKASDRRMLARFEREVKATAQLTHWNTVQVYDYGCTPDGTFYYSMEYLQGLNLRQLVDEHGPQSPGRVVFVLRQLCGALHEAAQFGLVHRDIKPSNIFLAERGQLYDVAKLLDFGLVRPASFGTCPIRNVSRQLQGSPRYMCPEQAQGQKPDCRGDLYSLACVAYYLLTGRPPFEGENSVMLVVAHASIPAPRVENIGAAVPQDLADIVMKCLSKNPRDRFQSPRDLLEALERCQCASEWSWKQAEEWWSNHPDETHRQICDRPSSGSKTQPEDSPSTCNEPDPTFIYENSSQREREVYTSGAKVGS